MTRVGFPWAEIAEDGSSVDRQARRHRRRGLHRHRHLPAALRDRAAPPTSGPDVSARFDTIRLEQVGRDRVRIHATKGEPPPATLKVAMNEIGGYRKDLSVALTGLDIEAKARLVEDAFWVACPFGPRRLRQRDDEADPHRQARSRDQRGGGGAAGASR